jgi:hemolysin III
MSKRTQTLEEEVVNAITHGLGVLFALIATPFLLEKVSKTGDSNAQLAVMVFAFGMFVLYLASTLYHAVQEAALKEKLLICDFIGIFILIGGSYAPFVYHYTDSQTATIFLTFQWVVIFIGSVLKLFFGDGYEKLSLLTYVILGWSVVFVMQPIRANMPYEVSKWLLGGGISYSIGIFFFRLEKQKYAHAVWHVFVLGGTVAHFIAIWKINDFVKIK